MRQEPCRERWHVASDGFPLAKTVETRADSPELRYTERALDRASPNSPSRESISKVPKGSAAKPPAVSRDDRLELPSGRVLVRLDICRRLRESNTPRPLGV